MKIQFKSLRKDATVTVIGKDKKECFNRLGDFLERHPDLSRNFLPSDYRIIEK